jgi:hypothetical protein
MLESSTMMVRGIQSQERRVGVPVHFYKYAYDEGKGIKHYKGTLRERGRLPTNSLGRWWW